MGVTKPKHGLTVAAIRVKAKLELKEKELDVKEKISKSQVKMASDNNS